MSDKVLICVGKNTYESISKERMNKSMRNRHMKCNGRIYGDENDRCDAPMSAMFSREDDSCIGFTEKAKKRHPHSAGCEYDKRVLTRSVVRYDFNAADKQKESYLDRMFRKENDAEEDYDVDIEIDLDGDLDEFELKSDDGENGSSEIRIRKRDPSTLVGISKLLAYLKTDHMYMNVLVRDWIIDHRTFSFHFNNGMPKDRMFVVGKLCNYKSLEFLPKDNEWIIAGCTFGRYSRNKDDHWFYCLKCDDKSIEMLRKFSRSSTREEKLIVVCSRWKQSSDEKNLFISEPINGSKIAFVERKYLEIH